MHRKPVYLDYNATTPCDPGVVEAMMPCFTQRFGNAASRDHSYGWEASEAVEHAREEVASLIGARPKDMIFTSGATEAINLALKGGIASGNFKGNHIITAQTEHEAVLDTCRYLENNGYRVTYLQTGADGHIDLKKLEESIGPETIGIALMYANNETGVIHPVRRIGELAEKHGVLFMCDASQAAGKIPVNIAEDHIDLLVFSAHKMYGPKGMGAMYVNKKIKPQITPLIHGGKHENGYRSGTLNVPGIAGFGKAASICREKMEADAQKLDHLRNILESKLLAIPGTSVNGDRENRLPHVTNISFEGVEGESLVLALARDIAVSRGSACSGNVHAPSHVLRAMGISDENARNSLRISLGRFTTDEEIRFAAEVISKAVTSQRKKYIINTR